VALGCIMMRKCHLNTCPVGIATQDEELRRKFAGKPEHVVNFFFMLAEEMRGYMARMGFRTVGEMVGRADMLRVDESALHSKTRTLDLGPILTPASVLAPGEDQVNTMGQDHFSPEATGLPWYKSGPNGEYFQDLSDVPDLRAEPQTKWNLLDDVLIEESAAALEHGTPVTIAQTINNRNRSVGAMLSNEISKRYGGAGLPDGTITVHLEGHTGQSFGFTLARGVTLSVQGDANDGCGKGLSGGEIAIRPGEAVMAAGLVPSEHVILGNCALYGATSGRAFFRGKAGERFCVRNSGAVAVVEGMGDHGCEYMTGGRVVCLGSTGINFGAGMSGGIAYILDTEAAFATNCNMGMVELERVETDDEAAALRGYLEAHVERTGSSVAAELLATWPAPLASFVKVMPTDYKRVMLQQQQADAAEPSAAIG